MMNLRRLAGFVFFAFFCAAAAISPSEAAGLTVADALKLSGSARADAMGSSTALDYAPGGNPAIFDGADTAYFKFHASPLGVRVLNAGGKYAFGRFTAGAWLLSQDAGDVDIHRLPFEDVVTEMIYTQKLQSDTIVSGFFGWAPTRAASAGVALKYITTSLLGQYSLSAVAADAGLFWRPGRMAVAALARNVGPAAGYSDSPAKFPLPTSYSLGAAYPFANFLAQISADYSPADAKVSYTAGGEYRIPDEKIYPLNSMAFRAGMRFPPGRNVSPENISLGFAMGFSNALMEYAFLPVDDAGYSHHIGISYRFAHKTVVPESRIMQVERIKFVDGEFEEASFKKLEDIAMTLKENSRCTVRVEGHFEFVDKVLDYFVRVERLSDAMFVIAEKETDWVDITLIGQ
jgi:hypothetical protein